LVGVSFLVPLGALALLVCTAIQMRWAQEINETGNRRVMGEWLKAQSSSSKETVFVECLGYIGFFSNLKMYDFPGLCSPEVVAARRKCPLMGNYPNYFPQLISDLEPDWVVLRASEIYLMSQVNRDVLARYYHLARVFDTKARIDAVRFLPGRGYLLFDSHFEIYRRNDAPGGPAGARVHIPAIAVPIMVENLTVRDTWAGPAYNSQGRIAAHASSRLVATVPARATTVAGEYGFFPGAYEGANGALFSIDVVSKSGTKTRIFSAPLDPKAKPGDRGDRPFSAPLTMTDAATVEFLIAPPPGQSNAFGWTYWTNLKFEIPK
jgi:hypothetical protein